MHRRVWGWYQAFCVLNAVLNVAFSLIFLRLGDYMHHLVVEPDPDVREAIIFAFTLTGQAFALIGFLFSVLNLLLIFRPRSESWYTAHLVNIALGLATGILTIPLFFLLIAWVKPTFKEWFLNPEPSSGG